MTKKITYICQFCAKETPAKDWIADKCPKCGRQYNWMIAQDSEE